MTKHKSDITVVPNLDRLQEMADFLKKLEPEKFGLSYSQVIEHVIEDGVIRGTKCDAIGWLPAIWPNLFKWFGGFRNLASLRDQPEATWVRRIDDPDGDETEITNDDLVRSFLGLSVDNFYSIFWSINRHDSTPIDIASQIESFIAEHSPKEQIVNA